MKNYLSNLDPKLLKTVREIGKQAEQKGYVAYIVGGIVRDLILKRKNYDLDVVVEGDAIELARDLAKKCKGKVVSHNKFKTASLKISETVHIDFATARKESYAHSGALPHVRPGALKEDLIRRDFTINAMAIAINPERFGQLTDEFGGLQDLSKKVIRVLHPKSFLDDPTRILRAIRFEQRFSFHMARQTLQWMKAALRKKAFSNVTPNRNFNEFKIILNETDPLKGLRRLQRLEGFYFLDPKLKINLSKISRLHQRIQKARAKTIYRQKEWWMVYFLGLLAKGDMRIIKRILVRFPWTKEQRLSIRQSKVPDDIVKKLSAQNLRPSQVYQILKPLTMETILYLRVATSKMNVNRRIDRYLTRDSQVRLCINGEDLKDMGLVSGNKMGKILKDVLYFKIDKNISSKQEELKKALLFCKMT